MNERRTVCVTAARLLGATMFAALSAAALAQDSYTLDPAHTVPTFEVGHLGFSVQRGTIGVTSGTVTLDRAARKGNLEVVIDAKSVSTGDARRDDQLRGADYFNVERFPTIVYRAADLAFDGDNLVGASGQLTLLGQTRPLALTVTNFKCGVHPITKRGICGAEAFASFKRSDFGMTYGAPGVGDEVKLVIQIEAQKS